jgi:ABC-type lipoprotein export system ATPase subunit
MNIDEHINILINNYNLGLLHKKLLIMGLLSSVSKEGFYWLLIYFADNIKNNEDHIYLYGAILIGLLIIHIPIERYMAHTRAIFLEELRKANTKYFYDRIVNIDKTQILNFDLVEFNNIIDHLNDYLDQHILNNIIKYEIILRFITLIIIAINKKLNLLIGVFFIYFAIINVLNENKYLEESELNISIFKYDSIIRNYIITSKNLLVNKELNVNYLNKNIDEFQKINKDITEVNNNLDMKTNICIIIYVLIILSNNLKKLNKNDFLFYFLIVYDIEYIGDKITEYYKNKIFTTKINKRLKYLYSYIPKILTVKNDKINKITINKIVNNKPTLNLININININDHILITGISGSGKTSLLYLLKGIIVPDYMEISPDINLINSQSYLTLANHKNIFNGNLYDIITNYDPKYDLNIINNAILLSKFNNYYDNVFINIENLSSGERIRLLVCKLIYNIIKNNYTILLFDEIDENLNDELAIEVCKNIRSIFKNKIILYITHNENVKKLFKNIIKIENGSNI